VRMSVDRGACKLCAHDDYDDDDNDDDSERTNERTNEQTTRATDYRYALCRIDK